MFRGRPIVRKQGTLNNFVTARPPNRQVLSTVNRRSSPVDPIQRSSQCIPGDVRDPVRRAGQSASAETRYVTLHVNASPRVKYYCRTTLYMDPYLVETRLEGWLASSHGRVIQSVVDSGIKGSRHVEFDAHFSLIVSCAYNNTVILCRTRRRHVYIARLVSP